MLKDADIFNPIGSLPDASRLAAPEVKNSSALAGIMAGRDFTEAISAAANRELETKKIAAIDSLDQRIKTQQEMQQSKQLVERKNLSARLRASVAPDRNYSDPVYPTAPLPGTEGPVAPVVGGDNILGTPPPDDSLFPTAPDPLLPPPKEEIDLLKFAY